MQTRTLHPTSRVHAEWADAQVETATAPTGFVRGFVNFSRIDENTTLLNTAAKTTIHTLATSSMKICPLTGGVQRE